MDFIKVQLERISQQLGGLSATQKMLTATLVAIMAMTLFYWARYAGEAEMEAVLDQSMSAEDISRIRTYLQGRGITAKVVGDKVMVPVDRKFEVLADLGYAQMLPRDTQGGIEQLTRASMFHSPTITAAMLNNAKETALAQILRRFPQVREANVIIDATERRAFEQTVRASATVNLITKGEQAGKQLIHAAADLVAGSVAGLSRGRVTVIVDGKSHQLPDKGSEDSLADGLLEQQKLYERKYKSTILEQLSYIPGAVVSVHVAIDPTTIRKNTHTVDPKNKISEPEQIRSTNEETSGGGRSGEPGAGPNTGTNSPMSIDGAVPASSTAVGSTEDTKLKVDYGREESASFTPAGKPTVMGAAVRLPRSYYISALKLSKDLDEAALMGAVKPHLESIRNEVVTCTGLKPESISVETYIDGLAELSAPATAGVTGGSMTSLLGSHGKEIALGVLAVISLFMVSSMVRKGTPATVVAAPLGSQTPISLSSGEDVAGEATDGNAMLDGMELDEDAMKTQQMLTQVQDLVKENPDAAAGLVKRWLNR